MQKYRKFGFLRRDILHRWMYNVLDLETYLVFVPVQVPHTSTVCSIRHLEWVGSGRFSDCTADEVGVRYEPVDRLVDIPPFRVHSSNAARNRLDYSGCLTNCRRNVPGTRRCRCLFQYKI